MIEFLLYSSLTCSDADSIMLRMQANENLSENIRIELVETVKDSTPYCYWDAND